MNIFRRSEGVKIGGRVTQGKGKQLGGWGG